MNQQKVFVFAVDGADPILMSHFLSKNKLPNFKKLAQSGIYGRLIPTIPEVSPLVWTSFATGKNPGKHRILDILIKKPKSYSKKIGLYDRKVNEDGTTVYTKRRAAKTLWEILSEKGKKCAILHLPGTFPPDEINGVMVSGMGIPDLRETFGLTTFYTTKKTELRVVEIKMLSSSGPDRWIESEIEGALGAKVPVFFYPSGGGVAISLKKNDSEAIRLSVGGWSEWMMANFKIPSGHIIGGVFQFKLLEAGDNLTILRTPVQPSPYDPVTPYTFPRELSAEIAENLGHYKILDRTEDDIDNDTFLEDVWDRFESKMRITRYFLEKLDWNLFLTYVHTVDNVHHVMWRYFDPEHPKYDSSLAKKYGSVIEEAYLKADKQLGEFLDILDKNTTIVVLSDHGGSAIYKGVHLNTWLHREGYLKTLPAGEVEIFKGVHRVPRAKGSMPIDWKNTRAFSYGFTGIYLNVKGREPFGLIAPGREYFKIRKEIADKLVKLQDPENGQRVYKKVIFREQMWSGPFVNELPDFVPLLKKGYALAREDLYGQVLVNAPIVDDFKGRWTAHHAGPYDPEDMAGIFFIKGPRVRKGETIQRIRMIDIAPTLLHLMDIQVPSDMDGNVCYEIFA